MSFYNWNEKPPTLKAILESIVNFDRDTKVGLSKLASLGHEKIFSFDYELSDKINRSEFEINILNHFIDRRIGYETVGAFKLKLENKLNEIMPRINTLFNAIYDISILDSGETTIRTKKEKNLYNRTSDTTNNNKNSLDIRNSDMPQNRINDIKNGSYVSDYTYQENLNTGTNNIKDNSNDDLYLEEKTVKSGINKIDDFIKFTENVKDVYKVVYDELEVLFYNLV